MNGIAATVSVTVVLCRQQCQQPCVPKTLREYKHLIVSRFNNFVLYPEKMS
jgi:hypothetical protein